MSRFSINELMNDPKIKDARRERGENERDYKIIPIDDIVPSPNNKYGIRDIEEIAANIEMVGLIHNLTVRETEVAGKYEIVSGERRYRGLQMLVADGKSQYAAVPCMVEVQKDPLLAELELLFANALARNLTDYEKTYQAGRIKEILHELKQRGHKFKGRMREVIAELLKVSPAQVGRMESINKNLVPEVKDEFKKGKINMTAAYEASRLPQDQQEQVLEDIQQSGKVDIKTVKGKRERKKPTHFSEPKAIIPPTQIKAPPISTSSDSGATASAAAVESSKTPTMPVPRKIIIQELRSAASALEEWNDTRARQIVETCCAAAALIEGWADK